MKEALCYDLERIRSDLSLVELYEREVGPARRAGSSWVGICPFHEERSGSFSMRLARDGWRGHCFGCGWDGSVFDFVMGLRGCSFSEAAAVLGGLLGLAPSARGRISPERPKETRKSAEEEWRKPWMPRLEVPTAEELGALAALRGLQVPGLEAAAAEGVLRMADWPWVWDGARRRHVLREDWSRSWAVTDAAGWTAQYRRLDGGLYRIGGAEDGRTSKSWSTRNVAWPVGAGNLGDRWRVALVEGSPDVLAAFHFLWGFGLLGKVAVCGVLGAANRLAEQSLEHFKDREVRIFAHADVARDGRRTGWEGARRWQEQLSRAGAIVTVANLDGLEMRNGQRVKDVNDCVYAEASTIEEEVRPLFSEWGL